MGPRTPLSAAIEAHILMASARRCALCFGLDGDLRRKKGQIAHISQDASDADESNLAFLCLEHHDEYDSRTSQVKGITEAELPAYKARLIEVIKDGRHLRSARPQSASASKAEAIRGHDERLFRQGDDVMPERHLTAVLDKLQSDDSYWISQVARLDNFRAFFSETGTQYIDPSLSARLRDLLAAIDRLLLFLAEHFFVFPENQQNREDLRLCLYPELNIDRSARATVESSKRYSEYQNQLDGAAKALRTAYKDYRLAVKGHLHL